MRGSFFVGADQEEKFEVRDMTFGPLGPHDVLVNNKSAESAARMCIFTMVRRGQPM